MKAPRCAVTLNCLPSSACAAVAPRQMIARGFTSWISVSSHGRHAAISEALGLLVDAALAARLPLEVLHHIGDVDGRAIDPSFGERLVEQLPGRADERMTGQVFLIAGLLADEHQPRARRALAEHRLRAELVEVARLTVLRGLPNRGQRRAIGNQVGTDGLSRRLGMRRTQKLRNLPELAETRGSACSACAASSS